MFFPVQSQAYTVYGSGVNIGDITITLTNFNDIDGNALVMADFGDTGTFTIEPGSGIQEEQALFTGVTTNSDGTVTLTGIKSVGFITPYTQTAGFVKSHAGGVTVVLADTAFLYSQFASTANTQTFSGTDTFNIAPFIPTVASSATTQAASVGYVNSVALQGAAKASDIVFGITELSIAPTTASVPIAVGTNDTRVPTVNMSTVTTGEVAALVGNGGTPSASNTYMTQAGFQNGSEAFAVTAGTSTTYTITESPTPAGYVLGERIYIKTHVASGINPTINKNGLGAKSLYKQIPSGTTPLSISDLGTNQMAVIEYDGGAYQIVSPLAKTPLGLFGNGVTTHDVSATGTQTIAHGLGVLPKYVKITGMVGTNSTFSQSIGAYNGTTTSTTWIIIATANSTGANDTSNIIYLSTDGSGKFAHATMVVDATNLTLTWSKDSTPTGTANIIWEVQS